MSWNLFIKEKVKVAKLNKNHKKIKNWNDKKKCCFIWDHSFSTQAKFWEKLIFLPPDTRHTYMCVSGVWKC